MSNPFSVVSGVFGQAGTYARNATTAADNFTRHLSGALFTPPTLTLNWSSLAAPSLPSQPPMPAFPNLELGAGAAPNFGTAPVRPSVPRPVFGSAPSSAAISIPDFGDRPAAFAGTAPNFGNQPAPVSGAAPSFGDRPSAFSDAAPVFGAAPAALNIAAPTLSIDTSELPAAPPAFNIPPPSLSFPPVPVVPDMGVVDIPSAPSLSFPARPTLLTLNTVLPANLNLREDWLDRLDDMPVLEFVAPTPYAYTPSEKYKSSLLDNMKALLRQRLDGGTGLAPEVERAIWGRSRDRETSIALANEADVSRQAEALGYRLPPGVLTAQLRAAHQTYYDKLSGLSRDISIKQAEMEQQNLRETIAAGLQLEATLVDQAYKMERLAFDHARAVADNAIQTHNARVEHFRVLLAGYQTFAEVYKAAIDGEMAKVQVYRAQLDAENTKAAINKSLVDAYTAEIEGTMAHVEIYRAQVGGAQALVQLEQAKIGAAGEQIRAYVAQVNAETAKLEGYKAQAGAASVQMEAHRTAVQAFATRVEAQAEVARAHASHYVALQQGKANEWDGYRAQVAAAANVYTALQQGKATEWEGYRAEVAAAANIYTAEQQGKVSEWEAYRARVAAEGNIYTAQMQGKVSEWDAYRTRVAAQGSIATTQQQISVGALEAYRTLVAAQGSAYTAEMQGSVAEMEAYRAQVAAQAEIVRAEVERLRAAGIQSGALLDAYRAQTAATIAQAEMNTKVWETQIKQYEAGINAAIQTARVNADSTIASSAARLDAAKVGAQVHAQMASGAMAMFNASASISGSDQTGTNISYNYSGEVSSDVRPLTDFTR